MRLSIENLYIHYLYKKIICTSYLPEFYEFFISMNRNIAYCYDTSRSVYYRMLTMRGQWLFTIYDLHRA